MKKLLLVFAVAAIAAPAAGAGGWATVGLSSLPGGESWSVDITVLQHGQTPLAGVTPVVRVRDDGGKVVESFTATPTAKAGVYHADVAFPGEGTYSYEVYDGFTQYGGARTHTFKPVVIGASDGGFPLGWLSLALGIALALAVAVATMLMLRRRTAESQPIQLKEAT